MPMCGFAEDSRPCGDPSPGCVIKRPPRLLQGGLVNVIIRVIDCDDIVEGPELVTDTDTCSMLQMRELLCSACT